MCVLNPLKVTLSNYPADQQELLIAPGHPNRDDLPARELPFTRELYIDRNDFNEDTTLSRKKFKRLVSGEYVRLRSGYVIRADEVIKDGAGEIIELICSYIPGTVGQDPPEGVRPRGVIHWVSATNSVDCDLYLYEKLFTAAAPDAGEGSFMDHLNPESLQIVKQCKAELGLAGAEVGQHFQFEREGYYAVDAVHSSPGKLVFNRTIALR
jgi:glutaminyl-tRNA synthetase